jgi:hypothetical protein
LLSRFHRPSELLLELLQPPVEGALGLPPGQPLDWIGRLRAEGIGLLEQGPQLVGPEAAPVRGVPLRQITGEGRLVPGAAVIGPEQQSSAQAKQQGKAGA